MTRFLRSLIRRQQKGAVAVEAALSMMFIFVPLISGVFLLGKFFWYYTAVQKAANDAALYMAGAPLSEIRNGSASALALEIIEKEMSGLVGDVVLVPTVSCGYRFGNTNLILWNACISTVTPTSVQSAIYLNITHPFFSPLSNAAGWNDSVNVLAYSKISYVGI